jgi:hypothetical protein
MKKVKAAPDGFRVTPFEGLPPIRGGRACLTFHRHDETLAGRESYVFVGHAAPGGEDVHLRVERRLGDFSVPESSFKRRRRYRAYGRKLAPRLEDELQRRGKALPELKRQPTTPR